MSECLLNEVCELIVDCPHTTAKDEGKGYPLVRTPNIGKGRLVYDGMHRVCEDVYNKRNARAIPQENDLIFAREATAGNAALIQKGEKVCLGQRTVLIRPNQKKVNSAFLTYFLLAPKQQYNLLSTANGATVAHVNLPTIRNLKIDLPELSTQQRIATILSRYDSLIENYQKQIKLLEEAAQRLYKEWFVDLHFPGHENTKIVDGVPEGWEKKPVSQLGEYLNGFAFKPSDWQKSGKPIIKIKEMGNGVSNDTPRNNGERVPAKYLVKAGDLLFSWSATLMVIVWSGEEGWLNQHLFKVTPSKGIEREFLLQSISNTIEEFQNLTTGSTMKHIQRNKLDQVFVNVPNDEIMKRYSSIAEKERTEILHLSSQIRLLTEARDRLLPKLMSGEIEI